MTHMSNWQAFFLCTLLRGDKKMKSAQWEIYFKKSKIYFLNSYIYILFFFDVRGINL